MQKITLNAEKRISTGKGVARALRRSGYIPAVLYRAGRSTLLKLDKHAIVQFINSTMGEQVVVNLNFSDGNSKLALLKNYQVDPVRGELLHTDFYEVSLKEKVRVTVSVFLQGEPVGVKKEGGVLQQVLFEVEVECFPDKIPPHIDVDVSSLLPGYTLHVSDLPLPEEVKVLTKPEEAIATVVLPTEEVVEEVVPEEEVEPEVVKKAKKEEAEKEVAEEE